MENITLEVIYHELKKIEQLVYKMDEKVENFMGVELIPKKELEILKKTSKKTKSDHKPLSQLSNELGVEI